MRNNPVTYAQELIKKRGPKDALKLAESLVFLAEGVVINGGAALGDEIELKEQTEIRDGKVTTVTVTLVDNEAKNRRQTHAVAFWKNVYGYVKNRQPAQAS